jgi:hypothetical protein
MSGMHLLPVFFTTTNQRKRKKGKTPKRLQQAQIEHEKYLRKMGYDPNYKRKPTPLVSERVAKQIPDIPISEMDWSPCLKGKKSTLSGNYVVGQAYNKGNLVVLSKTEQSDVNTGKRR